MKKLLLCLFAALPAWGGLSINLNSTNNANIANNSIPALNLSTTPFVIEFSIDSWPASSPNGQIANVNIANIQIHIYNTGGQNHLSVFYNGAGQPTGADWVITSETYLNVRYQHSPATTSTGTEYAEAWDQNQNYLTGFGSLASEAYTGITFNGTSNGVCLMGLSGFCTSTNSGGIHFAYFRMYTGTGSLIPVNSTPPTTAQSLTNCLFSWKFDGGSGAPTTPSTADSCGSGLYPWSVQQGTISGGDYSTTLYQNPYAIARTGGIPSQDQAWATWVAQKLNAPNTLSGAFSYSQADATPSVSCAWSLVSGPSTPTMTGANTCTPTYTPTVASNTTSTDYTYQLTVTDANSNTASTNLEFGVVNYDANGVLIPPNADVTRIFGPMIAFGQNPWGYQDERAFTGLGIQQSWLCANYQICANAGTYPHWHTPGIGTAAYYFNGIGFVGNGNSSFPGTTVAGACTAANLATCTATGITNSTAFIEIADASKLPSIANSQSLPTWIAIGTSTSAAEVICVSASTGTTGPQVLTVCPEGRGLQVVLGNTGTQGPSPWSVGALVGESRIDGTGSKFGTDSNSPICPAGIPGPPGSIVSSMSTGTVSFSAANSTIIGSGGQGWTSSVIQSGYMIRIAATHSGGTPFAFWCFVSVTDSTHLACSTSAPADIDLNTPFSYSITTGNTNWNVTLGVSLTEGSQTVPVNINQLSMGCYSDTVMFFSPSHDIPTFDNQVVTGAPYSYDNAFGANNALGYNFYGLGLAARALYYRSGYAPALTLARAVDETWIRDPQISSGYAGGGALPLNQGGGVVGAMVALALDSGDTAGKIDWINVDNYIRYAYNEVWNNSQVCEADDTRDAGYETAWTALGAYYDNRPSYKSAWQTYLGTASGSAYPWHQFCIRPSASGIDQYSYGNDAGKFASTYNQVGGAPVTLNVTTNSTTVTAHSGSLSSGMCYGVASGSSLTLANGSTSATGAGFTGGGTDNWFITINGTTGGGAAPFQMKLAYTQTGGTSATIAAQWQGDSCTGTNCTWMIENNGDGNNTTIGNTGLEDGSGNLLDPNIRTGWACIYNSGGPSLTLDRPWPGPTSNGTTNYYPFVSQGFSLPAYGQQPYMMGIMANGLRWAALSDSALGTNYGALLNRVAQWQFSYGYNPNAQALNYATIFSTCQPNNATWVSGGSFVWTQSGCSPGGGQIDGARSLNNEGNASIVQYYTAQNQSGAAKTWVDTVYGSVWGNPAYTASGYYFDSVNGYEAGFTSNASFSENKWYPFAFGMGMSHMWPALRAPLLLGHPIRGGGAATSGKVIR